MTGNKKNHKNYQCEQGKQEMDLGYLERGKGLSFINWYYFNGCYKGIAQNTDRKDMRKYLQDISGKGIKIASEK